MFGIRKRKDNHKKKRKSFFPIRVIAFFARKIKKLTVKSVLALSLISAIFPAALDYAIPKIQSAGKPYINRALDKLDAFDTQQLLMLPAIKEVLNSSPTPQSKEKRSFKKRGRKTQISWVRNPLN